MTHTLDFVAIQDCPPTFMKTGARLVHSSLPEYYDLLLAGLEEPMAVIEAQLQQHSEINQGIVAFADGQPVGIICCYPLAERADRQTAALVAVLRDRPEQKQAILRNLRGYMAGIAALSGDGLYLSRVAVAAAWRKQGIASAMLKVVEEQAMASGFDRVALHVAADNAPARSYYLSHGYQLLPADDCRYLAMQKPLNPYVHH